MSRNDTNLRQTIQERLQECIPGLNIEYYSLIIIKGTAPREKINFFSTKCPSSLMKGQKPIVGLFNFSYPRQNVLFQNFIF